jgi:hypothetical protein
MVMEDMFRQAEQQFRPDAPPPPPVEFQPAVPLEEMQAQSGGVQTAAWSPPLMPEPISDVPPAPTFMPATDPSQPAYVPPIDVGPMSGEMNAQVDQNQAPVLTMNSNWPSEDINPTAARLFGATTTEVASDLLPPPSQNNEDLRLATGSIQEQQQRVKDLIRSTLHLSPAGEKMLDNTKIDPLSLGVGDPTVAGSGTTDNPVWADNDATRRVESLNPHGGLRLGVALHEFVHTATHDADLPKLDKLVREHANEVSRQAELLQSRGGQLPAYVADAKVDDATWPLINSYDQSGYHLYTTMAELYNYDKSLMPPWLKPFFPWLDDTDRPTVEAPKSVTADYSSHITRGRNPDMLGRIE